MSKRLRGSGAFGASTSLARPPARYAPIVFDLDGTLVDSAPGIAEALNALALAQDPVDVAHVRSLLSRGAAHLIKEALGVADRDIPDALQAFRKQYSVEPCRPEDLFPGVERALKEMRRWGSRLAVCTNKPQALTERVVECVGLTRYFDLVVGSDPSRTEKPDPATLLDICAQLNGTKPILIGDSMIDALTAQAASAPFVYAAYGYEHIENVPIAGVASSMAEVTQIVEKLLWLS